MDQGKPSVEGIARMIHETHRAFNAELGDNAPSAPFDALGAKERDNLVSLVRQILMGVEPPDLHASWVERMFGWGWILGTVKDPAASPPVHPLLVDWNYLPATARRKVFLAVAIVRESTREITTD